MNLSVMNGYALNGFATVSLPAGQGTRYSVVNIDNAWISANGNPPYILNTPYTLYILMEDLIIPTTYYGNVFKITAPNVEINRNGFSVIVNRRSVDQRSTNDINLSRYVVKAKQDNDYNNLGQPEDINYLKMK